MEKRSIRPVQSELEIVRPQKRQADNLNPQGKRAQEYHPAQDHLYKRNLERKPENLNLPDIFLADNADIRTMDEIPTRDKAIMELKLKQYNEDFDDAVSTLRMALQDITGDPITDLNTQNIGGLLRESENADDFKKLYQEYFPEDDKHWEEKFAKQYDDLKAKAMKCSI